MHKMYDAAEEARKAALREHGNTKHGFSKGTQRTPEYQSWSGMINRCKNPSHICYHRYGARGISVCERWKKFENFLADMGRRPEGTSLDRIDPNGNYEPTNCRWANAAEQSSNTTRISNAGIHGVSWQASKGHWQIRAVRKGKHVLCTARKDFFEACCVIKSFLAREMSNV